MPPGTIIPLRLVSLPGCKRDGTPLEGNNYIDMKWCRMQRDLPRKIGGYRRLSNRLTDVSRGLHVYDVNGQTYVHSGGATVLERFLVSPIGVVSSIVDRTPAAFTTSTNNLWQFDAMYDTTSAAVTILAHAAPNAADISSSTARPVYYGSITGSGVLTVTTATSVSGGLVVLHPYAFVFGSDGILYWSAPNLPNDYAAAGSGSARVADAKIVRGLPVRAGAGNGPAGLFWTLNSVVRATFVGGTAFFNFDEITSQTSIMSSQSVIEYDGVFFWAAVDRFLMYNGVVREVPNDMNANWFFDNLNYTWRNRVFAFKVPRYGEIWWCYPRGTATECTHAVIYNVNKGYWYDTELPNSGRTAAHFAQVFSHPLLTGLEADTSTDQYRLWEHEFGVDELDGADVRAVQSYFETAEFMLPQPENPGLPISERSMLCYTVEPDFVQTGGMTLTIKGRWNSRSPLFTSDPYPFAATAATSAEEILTTQANLRQMRFLFDSNVQGGDYQMGKVLIHIQEGDGRLRS